jgi:hypothetical protein
VNVDSIVPKEKRTIVDPLVKSEFSVLTVVAKGENSLLK